jgi:hypothetical protein
MPKIRLYLEFFVYPPMFLKLTDEYIEKMETLFKHKEKVTCCYNFP